MREYLERKYGVTTPVFVLSVVSFFNDVASEMLYPIVPIFLTSVLGAPASIVGLIEGIAEGTASLLKGFSGRLSDMTGKRKIFVVVGYGLGTIANLFYGIANTWHLVLAGKFTSRLGKGIRTSARDALIAENVEPKMLGRAFGFHRGTDTLGAILGPLLAILLLHFYQDNYRLMFFLALIPTSIALILLVVYIKEKQRSVIAPSAEKFRISALPRKFLFFVVISTIFAIGNSSDAFLILRAKGLGFSLIVTVLAYVLYNITYSAFSLPAGIISDKLGEKKVYVLGLVIFAVVYAGFALIQSPLHIWILFPVYGFYMALTDGVSKSYIANIVPTEKLGTAYGFYYMLTGIAAFIASLVGGLLWTHWGPETTFFYGAVLALTAALLFVLVEGLPSKAEHYR
ncbi:MAG TPA: MFS transporter [Candidatus Paceibacterota bacterium]|nr:MFS transporter [Candidatus Paceibacterota bacterium]